MMEKEYEMKKCIGVCIVMAGMLIMATGCATVPLAPVEMDTASKRFDPPSEGTAGVYIYRRWWGAGTILKRELRINGKSLGKTAPGVYFHVEVDPGTHTLATEGEFDFNTLRFTADEGSLYFFTQVITPGIFVGSSVVMSVAEDTGKVEVLSSKQAKSAFFRLPPKAEAKKPQEGEAGEILFQHYIPAEAFK